MITILSLGDNPTHGQGPKARSETTDENKSVKNQQVRGLGWV
jgi:hypothetical protein